MATYFVGDIQGCFDELLLLLERVKFNKDQDQLWLTGDLVARGPKSLETLRFVKSLGESATVILGNHDLHLLAVSQGLASVKKRDKTEPILLAPDGDELIQWLRHQPLLAINEKHNVVMTHAGISPQWDMDTAIACAQEIEQLLRSEQWLWLLKNMYQNQPTQWNAKLTGMDRYCYIINAFTRMRFCTNDGILDMEHKNDPKKETNSALLPLFDVPNKKPLSHQVIFGHWAALMGYESDYVIALDTGCVWGEHLTLYRIDDRQYFTQKSLPS